MRQNRNTPQITVEPEGQASHTITLPRPDAAGNLADILERHGFPLNTRCGQRGLCQGCEVDLREGRLREAGNLVEAPATLRACRAQLLDEPGENGLVVRIPGRSRIEHRPQVSETFRLEISCAHQPLFPGDALRDTVFAVDIGTTTVAVMLIDIATGTVLSWAGGFNAQIRFGDNVLTRIDAARSGEKLRAMQRAIMEETIAPLLERACQRAQREPARLAGGAVAGNTTMLHLLLSEDPTSLGVAPFRPVFLEGRRVTARKIGLNVEGLGVAAEMPLQLLPGIAAYIGADITAGVQATGMQYSPGASLLVDFGTNGEIVLQHQGALLACATAAGPAFEGCGLSHGARAREGAISGLSLLADPWQLKAETIGNIPLARAEGICGSAYVDFLAEGRQCGLLEESGRFSTDFWQSLPAEYRVQEGGARGLRLGPRSRAAITEADIALLLQAKAAIAAGIECLLDAAGLAAGQIATVYLAGGFGMHLDVGHAIAAGLLPGFRVEQVRVVGNTALAGALLALLDSAALAEMEALRKRVQVLELNLLDDFEDRYIDHLTLP